MRRLLLCGALLATACAPVGLAAIRRDARAAAGLAASDAGRAFADAAATLPAEPRRTLHRDPARRRVLDDTAWRALPPAEQAPFRALVADEDFYYQGKYGTPLAYVRALDLLGARGFRPGPGIRLLDFGYGAVGQLRALALLGVAATGVDVDPLLPVLYAGASGPLGARGGSVRLLDGRWPADPTTAAGVGDGYDVVIAKNTLKRGYIHPDRPADEKLLIKLGVDDAAYLAAVSGALKPGGLFLIYNICPAPTPPDKPFVPWSDGRSPFSRAAFEAAGLTVLAFDADDAAVMRRFARAFAWDHGPDRMDLARDFSVLYTLAQKPR